MPMSPEGQMDLDEQWAKTYVYSPRSLRIIMCPSGALAIFDNCGRWIGFAEGEALIDALRTSRGWQDPRPLSPEPPSLASSEELGF